MGRGCGAVQKRALSTHLSVLGRQRGVIQLGHGGLGRLLWKHSILLQPQGKNTTPWKLCSFILAEENKLDKIFPEYENRLPPVDASWYSWGEGSNDHWGGSPSFAVRQIPLTACGLGKSPPLSASASPSVQWDLHTYFTRLWWGWMGVYMVFLACVRWSCGGWA